MPTIQRPGAPPERSHGLPERRRKEIASLARKKYRDRLGEFLVEGMRSVEAAVQAGASLVELLVSEAAVPEAERRGLLGHAPVRVLPERELARLSDVETTQGVAAVARIALLPAARLTALRTLLALDGVQDPGNVGAAVRTAAWFGVEGVAAGGGTADFFNPKTVRAAMGGLWDVGLARADDLPALLDACRRAGRTVYGADLDGVPSRRWSPRSPSVLVLGSEAHGLSPAVRALVDERVRIEGGGSGRGVESLNVSVAAGILMYRWAG